jgi:hypothetical protein
MVIAKFGSSEEGVRNYVRRSACTELLVPLRELVVFPRSFASGSL